MLNDNNYKENKHYLLMLNEIDIQYYQTNKYKILYLISFILILLPLYLLSIYIIILYYKVDNIVEIVSNINSTKIINIIDNTQKLEKCLFNKLLICN